MPILIENFGSLRKVTISNPKRKNALNPESYAQLTVALNDASSDDSVSIVAVTGDGDFYSSGNDIKASFVLSESPAGRSVDAVKGLIEAFYKCSKVLICVVNGPCIGIAATTAILCDIIYAVDTAYFSTPFSQLALCAEGCSSYTFPRILGRSKASEMLLLNHKLSAAEAYHFGMVSQVFKQSELDSILWPKIRQFSELPQGSLLATKRLMSSYQMDVLQKSNDQELMELTKRFESPEFIEAMMAFMNRKSKL